MKRLFFFPVLPLFLLLSACGTAGETPAGSPASIEEFTVSNTEASASEGDFIYRLVSEKEEFPSGGPVEIYAELEYVGDQESIEIFHAGSAFYFPVVEKTRDYEIFYGMEQPLIPKTLTKGEPLRERYSGSGGYSEQDDAAYIEFTKGVMNNQFPRGYYVVSGYADFFTEFPNGDKTDYQIQAVIDFKVVD